MIHIYCAKKLLRGNVEMLTKKDIFKFLETNNIKHDDKVTIHCSLRAIGEIENGVDGLIDAFCQYLTEGLFIVPTHTWANVNKETPFFDVKTTEPCIGTLAKVAAFRSDGVRSLHPTHSAVAFGKNAAEFIKGEENAMSPAPANGWLSRFYEENGKILLVGVGHERNTYLHAVDERLDIPDRLNPDTFVATIKDWDGNIFDSKPIHTHLNSVVGSKISTYFYPYYKEVFEKTGAVTYGKLGNALVYCCDARKMADDVQRIWERSGQDETVFHQAIPEKYYK